MDARSNSAGSKVDIFSRNDRGEVAGMIDRHLRWQEGQYDNLVSWTSSLMFALVYFFYLHANMRDGSPFDHIFLCIVDTTQFPNGVFLRGSDLIRAFRAFDESLNNFGVLRSGRFYFGEYLSQGALKIEGKCRIVSAWDMIDRGLYILQPELERFAAWERGYRAPWANPVVELREVFYQRTTEQRQETRKEELEAAIRISGLFGGVWRLPVAANLLALLPRRRDDPIILEEFRASTFAGERTNCGPSCTRVIAYDHLPEVQQFSEIMKDIYRDFCVGKMKEHLEVVQRRLKRVEFYTLRMQDSKSQEEGTPTNLSDNTEVKHLDTILDLGRRLRQNIQGSEPIGATQTAFNPFTRWETEEALPRRGLNPFTD